MPTGLFIPRKDDITIPGDFSETERQFLAEVQNQSHTNMLAIEKWSKRLTSTRILIPDGSKLSGDVSVLAGNGIIIAHVSNGFAVVAANPTQSRSVPAFAPGAAVARILQRMAVANPVLQSLDVYLGTAPVGTDASNHANVVVKGTSSGGPVVIPLSAGVVEYHIGLADMSTPLAGITPTGATASGNPGAIAFPFQVSTNVTIFNASVALPGGDPTPPRIGIATGVVSGVTNVFNPNWITDGQGNQCFKDSAVTSGNVLVTFPTVVGFTLVPSTTYWLITARPDVGNVQTSTGQLGNTVGTGHTNLGNILTGFGTPLQPHFVGGGVQYANVFDTNYGALQWPQFGLYGAVMGTPLGGLVELSQTITGAPPATTGSDANIVAQV